MNGIISLNVTAVSRNCISGTVNNDRFYINGRRIYRYETDSIQLSVENSGNEYIFALGSGMDRESSKRENSFSTMEELENYQKQMRSENGDIDSKFEGFCDCVKGAGDIIYSMSTGNSTDYESPPSFAGIILVRNKAAVLNMGSTRIYMFHGGNIRQLTSDYKKAERLRKLGILTDEQAEVLSTHFGIPADAEKADIKRSEIFNFNEGDLFLLCSPGIVDAVDEEIVSEIINSANSPDEALSMLISEAIKNGCEDTATAVIVSIQELNARSEIVDDEDNDHDEENESFESDDSGFTFKKRGYMSRNSIEMGKNRSKKKKMIKKIVSTTVACVVVVLMIYGLVRLGNIILGEPRENDGPAFSDDESTQSYNESEYETSDTYEDTSDDTSDGTTASTIEDDTGNELQNDQPVFYEVKSGDTLYGIARKFYDDPDKYNLIAEKNNIANPDDIKVGQILTIPELP